MSSAGPGMVPCGPVGSRVTYGEREVVGDVAWARSVLLAVPTVGEPGAAVPARPAERSRAPAAELAPVDVAGEETTRSTLQVYHGARPSAQAPAGPPTEHRGGDGGGATPAVTTPAQDR